MAYLHTNNNKNLLNLTNLNKLDSLMQFLSENSISPITSVPGYFKYCNSSLSKGFWILERCTVLDRLTACFLSIHQLKVDNFHLI